MNQMLKLSDKDFKAGVIKTLKHLNATSLKINENNQQRTRDYKRTK